MCVRIARRIADVLAAPEDPAIIAVDIPIGLPDHVGPEGRGPERDSELAMNAALGMIEAAAPRDEIEGALAVQMACTHTAAMAVLAKLDVAFATERHIAAFGSAAARLMRAYAIQVEVLRRMRTGGQQFVRVEHVHVNDGGQAVIRNVRKSGA